MPSPPIAYPHPSRSLRCAQQHQFAIIYVATYAHDAGLSFNQFIAAELATTSNNNLGRDMPRGSASFTQLHPTEITKHAGHTVKYNTDRNQDHNCWLLLIQTIATPVFTKVVSNYVHSCCAC
jgi:hypothetical protein